MEVDWVITSDTLMLVRLWWRSPISLYLRNRFLLLLLLLLLLLASSSAILTAAHTVATTFECAAASNTTSYAPNNRYSCTSSHYQAEVEDPNRV